MLQAFASSSQEGTITAIHGNQEGDIAFGGGVLIATRVGRVMGIKALERMLQWEEGRFEFYARIDPDIERDAPTHLKGSVLEALCAIDEPNRAAAALARSST